MSECEEHQEKMSLGFGQSALEHRRRTHAAVPAQYQATCRMQEYIHTYITLHYITLHYITLHYITLHYITLPYEALSAIENFTSGFMRLVALPFSRPKQNCPTVCSTFRGGRPSIRPALAGTGR